MSFDVSATSDLLIDMSGWYMETALLEWALDARLAERVSVQALGAVALGEALGIEAHRLAAVLDGLVGMGILDLVDDGYRMPADMVPLLTPGGPAYLGDHVRHHATYWRRWADLRSMLRPVTEPAPWMQDISIHDDQRGHELLLRSSAAECSTEERVRVLEASSVADGSLLVDLGGGHGRLGMVAAELWGLTVETWDVPMSQPIWESCADELPAELRGLVSFHAVDLLDPVTWSRQRPDVSHCVLSHVVANFDGEPVVELLRSMFATFPCSSVSIVTPWRPYEDARDPLGSLLFDVLIQSASRAGGAHSNAAMRSYIAAAGGRVERLTEVDGSAVWVCRSER